ncbi:MAG: beta-propeller fold lactonase family protein [Actinobacteria bacterium]|nr:beta-propeller fold lactonase family protein [Actinomycetota bacterium]
MQMLIGSYSILSPWAGAPSAHGAGIVAASLHAQTGMRDQYPARFEVNPSFLALDEGGRHVWAITEPERGGELLRFPLTADGVLADGDPARIATGADAPCHVALGPGVALVSHYHGGVVSVVVRDALGAPDRVAQLISLPAAGEGWNRSGAVSRPHAAMFLPGGEAFVVADCGRDLVVLYGWDRAIGRAELLHALPLAEGSGPRHLAWHAGSSTILVSNQESGGVTVLRVAGLGGAGTDGGTEPLELRVRQVLSGAGIGRDRTVPSEIAVHPGGEYAVLANRRDDSLTVYGIGSDGTLAELGSYDAGGCNPRHFAFAPDGSALVVAQQDSDELTVFRWAADRPVDPVPIAVATPTAVLFVP